MTLSFVVGFSNLFCALLFRKRSDDLGSALFWLNICFAFAAVIVIIGDTS